MHLRLSALLYAQKRLSSVEFRQPAAVGLDQRIDHLDDRIDVQLASGVRVEHGGLIDVLLFVRDSGLDGQKMDVDVRHVHGGALHRERAGPARMHAGAVHETRHLHARIFRQIRDQAAGVENVAADLIGNAGGDGLHDVGGVLTAAGMVKDVRLVQRVALLGPARDLIDAAAGVFVERDVEALDQLRIAGLDVERIVLRVVLARFGAVIAELVDVIEAHHIAVLFRGIFRLCAALDLGIKVIAEAVAQLQKPCHMVDTGNLLAAQKAWSFSTILCSLYRLICLLIQ